MSDKKANHFKSFLKDMIFIVPFFFVMLWALLPSIPTYSPFWLGFWGIMGSLCVTGVAWLALQMFKVVFIDHEEIRKGVRREDS